MLTKSISHIFSVLFIILSVLALTFSTPAITLAQTSEIRYAKPAATGAGDCSDWANACTLQIALTGASSGDEIWVAAGTYKPTNISTNREATFLLKDGVSLYGGFTGTETSRNQRNWETNVTILSGDINNNDSQTPILTNLSTVTGNAANSHHVVTLEAGTAVLDGFTITAGNAPGNYEAGGGGMLSMGNPVLMNVAFTGNKSGSSGGGMSSGGSPRLMNVTFTGNSAGSSGGGMSSGGSTPALTNVTFTDNSAGERGGGMSSIGSPTLTNVTFNNNSATYEGGGIYIGHGNPTLMNITFISNTADYIGGGMFSDLGNPTLTNVTFTGNSATYAGGAHHQNGDLTIHNTIFWGNTATTAGAQIEHGNGGGTFPGTFNVNDSIVQGGCPAQVTCTNIITTDPMLGTLGNYGGFTQTIPLSLGSSAIDTGNDATCTASDQRNADRPVGAHCDIGAYEYDGIPRPDTYIATHPTDPTLNTNASFTFFSPDSAAIFECSLDGAAFESCSSPQIYTGLSTDTHVFAVRAKDLTAHEDSSPASFGWAIYPTHPHTAGVRYAAPGATGDCVSWATACALQDALFTSISGDEIWVMTGTYKPATESYRSATFQLKDGVAVYGGFAGTETTREQRNPTTNLTILSGDLSGNDNSNVKNNEPTRQDNSYHVVSGANNATLDGFVITAGNANHAYSDLKDHGGGMHNNGSSPTLRNITFSNNSAMEGGGMYNASGSNPILTDVIFSNNSSRDGSGLYNNASSPTLTNVTFNGNLVTENGGGGMYNEDHSNPSLLNVTFSNNSTLEEGGGMYNHDSNPILMNVTFSNNSATYEGGGMYNRFSNPILMNVTFSNNSVTNMGSGGGIYNQSSDPTLTNVTFSDNSAWNGGGISNSSSDPTLTNITFSNNAATNKGGGMNNSGGTPLLTNVTFNNNSANDGGGMYNSDSHPEIRNTIFWGNMATIAEAQIYNSHAIGSIPASAPNISDSIVQDGCPTESICTNVISANPMLGTLGNYGGFTQTIPLLAGSSAVDGANDAICSATDQRGESRPVGWHCDIGAYESEFVISTFTPSPSPTGTMTVTMTASTTNTSTATRTVTKTPTITRTPSLTRTITVTHTQTLTPTATHTEIPTGTMTATSTNTETQTATSTPTPTGTGTMTRTMTATATATRTPTTTKTPTPASIILTLVSIANQDGWVLESSETSNKGGTLDSTVTTLRLGDDATKKQYRSILSFNTSAVPDTAIITSVTLKLRWQAIVGGGNPVSIFQGFFSDVKTGFFGTAAALQTADFQAAASKIIGPTSPTLTGGWYSINLLNAKTFINKLNSNSGLTQIRLRFKLDDNNNALANYLSLYSGNASSTADRPQLVIQYVLPININTAGAEILDSLPGIGPTTAQAIVDYRTNHGSFLTVDDLLKIPGIGPSTLEQIRPLVTV